MILAIMLILLKFDFGVLRAIVPVGHGLSAFRVAVGVHSAVGAADNIAAALMVYRGPVAAKTAALGPLEKLLHVLLLISCGCCKIGVLCAA
jgi:hypothetical protein